MPAARSRRRSQPGGGFLLRFTWAAEAAARKLLEIAHSAEAVQDGRIHIELINARRYLVEGRSEQVLGKVLQLSSATALEIDCRYSRQPSQHYGRIPAL